MSGQSDEIVWQIINQQFCSFKLKTTKDQTFCRNEYNVTGLCNRQSCPLANSRYATIRQAPDTGALYLYMKTVERSHMPSKWWERIRLSKNYAEALEQVDQRLRFWPKFLVHKCKQRLTRLTQVSIRTKRLAREQARLGETLVPKLAPKVRRREQTRERKALAAAKVERAIERELIERLRSGAYGDRPLNVEEGIWKKVLRGLERAGAERDVDLDEGIEEEEEGEVEREYEREGDEALAEVEYVSDIEGDSDEEDGDVGDMEDGFDDWLDGRSADDDEDEQEGSDESVSGEEASGEEASEDSEEDEDIAALKKKLDSLKRKRPAKPSKPSKKPSRASKGPKREIEYEFEKEPPVRQLVEA